MDIKVLASSSRANAYRISDGKTALLLEAGLSYKELQRALDFKITELTAVLITHEHKDHSRAVADLAKAGIDCYMSVGTKEALGLTGHRIHELWPRVQTQIGTWTVLPFETQHDAAEPLGYLLASGQEKLLFATDTYYIRYKFNELTHIMVECNYAADILQENVEDERVPAALKQRLLQSHFSLDNVKEFLRANDLSKVEEIHLLHLSDGNSDEARFKREIQELTGRVVMVAGK